MSNLASGNASRVGWWQGTKMVAVASLGLLMMSCSAAVMPPPVPPVQQKEPVFTLDAKQIKQGEVTQLTITDVPDTIKALKINFIGRTYTAFPQTGSDEWLALISVDPLQKTGTFPLLIKDQNDDVLYEQMVTVLDGGFIKQNIVLTGKMGGLEPEPGEMEAIARLKNTLTPVKYWGSRLIAPVHDCMNSPFGTKRYYNGKFSGNYHKGVDQRSPQGRVIRSIAAGKVMIARQYRLHGGVVGVDHGQGISSIYIHQSRIDVKPGQMLKQGDPVGLVGSTGFATGPHLHWGLYIQGNPVNPMSWTPMVPC
jgi:Peptidase family M23